MISQLLYLGLPWIRVDLGGWTGRKVDFRFNAARRDYLELRGHLEEWTDLSQRILNNELRRIGSWKNAQPILRKLRNFVSWEGSWKNAQPSHSYMFRSNTPSNTPWPL